MRIHFYVRFHTRFGQKLQIVLESRFEGDEKRQDRLAMLYYNDELWYYQLSYNPEEELIPAQIQYSYLLEQEDGEIIQEWGTDRVLELSSITAEEIQVIDTWNHAGEYENVFFLAPFREVLISGGKAVAKPKPYRGNTHIFKVKAPLLRKHEVLCITGSAKGMGEWESENATLMQKEGNWWVWKVNLSKLNFPIYYKYGVYDTKQKQFVEYETGDNRVLYDSNGKKKVTIIHDGFAHLPNNTWLGAGVAIPVFSLRSQKSFGTGEFTDLKLLVDWAKSVGMKMIQILPVNDTIATHTWKDSYPYAAISAFALNPLYLNLERVAGKEFAGSMKTLRKKQKELNEDPEMNYEEVIKLKLGVIRDLYQLQKSHIFGLETYQSFFDDNKFWLIPYAAFSYLRDKFKSSDFNTWKQYSKYNAKQIEKLVAPGQKHFDEIGVHYFTQFQLHLQLKEARDYAHKNGVIIKGDIPIGVNRYGVDAWENPELYHMDVQAGAPPDDFAVKGQNWGFPTYNWKKMREDGYRWWRLRFEQMSRYFDAFRIDHILGFFRIWTIPSHSLEGIMGFFDPAIPIHLDEFSHRGIWFDYKRYCEPFITDTILWEMFGPLEKQFKPFLSAVGDGSYNLKDEYATQLQIEEYFSRMEKNEESERIRHGLFDLISNVILFRVAGSEGKQFHFRFGMDNTFSFRHLEWGTQQKLKDLYVDYFYRRQDAFWMREALHKLPDLKRSTNMMICGEDLGMVPHCVPDVMKQLGILSLEIQRMPKDPKREFFHPNDAPYLSVVTPSTHDMSTIRGWWEEDRGKTQRFFNHELGQYGEAPSFCEAWINRAIVLQHLYSPAMWSIFQLQDLLGINEKLRRQNPHEERINVPANSRHYWRYRMHMTLEELIREKTFREDLLSLIRASGR